MDHSQRLLRSGFGGEGEPEAELFYLLAGALRVTDLEARAHEEALPEALAIYTELRGDSRLYRPPWRTIREMRTLLSELRSAHRYDLAGTIRDIARIETFWARFRAGRAWRRVTS